MKAFRILQDRGWIWLDFPYLKHDIKEVYQCTLCFVSCGLWPDDFPLTFVCILFNCVYLWPTWPFRFRKSESIVLLASHKGQLQGIQMAMGLIYLCLMRSWVYRYTGWNLMAKIPWMSSGWTPPLNTPAVNPNNYACIFFTVTFHILPIFVMVASLALGQACPSASEATMKNMSK